MMAACSGDGADATPVPGSATTTSPSRYVTEASGTATFTVVLDKAPTADVTLNLASGNPAEAMIDKTSLTFTAENFDTPQTVTITGVDDAAADGHATVSIDFSASTSDDTTYDGLVPPSLSVVNLDDETAVAQLTVDTPASSEAGTPAEVSVVLTYQPTDDVVLALQSSDTSEGTPAAASLTFTSANWDMPQSVMIDGEDDALVDLDQAYALQVTGATSTGDEAAAILPLPGDAALSNTDDETVGGPLQPANFPVAIPEAPPWCTIHRIPSGKILVTNGFGNDLHVVSVDGSVALMFENAFGGNALGVTRAPDGMIYVGAGDDAIYACDPADGSVSLLATLGGDVNGLAVIPAGFGGGFEGQLVAATQDGAVTAVDLAGTTTVLVAAGGNPRTGLAMSSSGTLYVCDAGNIRTVDNAGTVTDVVTSGLTEPDGLATNDTNGDVYIVDSSDNNLVELASGTLTTLGSYDFDFGWWPSGIAYDPDANMIIAVLRTGSLFLHDLN
jgi:hypothetical protein